MNCIKDLREEFHLKSFGLSHERPGLFAKLQCGNVPSQIIWLLPWTLYFLVMMVVDYAVYKKDEGATWFRFLSKWNFILISITSVWDLSCTVYIAIKREDIIKDQCNDMTWYTRTVWVLYNIINSAAMVATLLHWALRPASDFVFMQVTDYSSINEYVIIMVFVVLNMCITAKPIRLLHVYQPMVFIFIYAIFSVIYQTSGGGAIYDPLDWDEPRKASMHVLLVILIAVPFFHLIGFLIFKFRQLICCECCNCQST